MTKQNNILATFSYRMKDWSF